MLATGSTTSSSYKHILQGHTNTLTAYSTCRTIISLSYTTRSGALPRKIDHFREMIPINTSGHISRDRISYNPLRKRSSHMSHPKGPNLMKKDLTMDHLF